MKMAVSVPPEGEVDEPKPPARLGRGGSISCCSKGRSLEKKLSHATLASDEGGGLAGAVPDVARRAELALTLTSGETDVEFACCSAALGADEDEEAAELLLPEEDELPLLVDELLDDLDDDESTDEETRREVKRVDRGPQLELNPRDDGEATAAEGLAIDAATAFFCAPTCRSRARA